MVLLSHGDILLDSAATEKLGLSLQKWIRVVSSRLGSFPRLREWAHWFQSQDRVFHLSALMVLIAGTSAVFAAEWVCTNSSMTPSHVGTARGM